MSSDIHALSGAYALDALDDDERAEFERHLAECPTCRAEVEGLREAAAGLAELTEVAPPASLRDKVLADVASVRPLPPVLAPRTSRRRRWAPLVAAAAAVVLVGGGLAWHPWDRPSSDTTISAVDRVAQAPDAQRVRAEMAGGGSVTLYRSVSQDRAAIVAEGLPALPEGKVYEMWLQDSAGSMVPAGLLPHGRHRIEQVLSGSASAAMGVGMTVEPTGGSAAPTSDPVALMEFGTA
jgi:anti-sigma-K factor RskA